MFKGRNWGRRCTVALLTMLIADQFPQSSVAFVIKFMFVGAGGLGLAMFWLWDGDASAQFTRFQRRQGTSGTPDQIT